MQIPREVIERLKREKKEYEADLEEGFQKGKNDASINPDLTDIKELSDLCNKPGGYLYENKRVKQGADSKLKAWREGAESVQIDREFSDIGKEQGNARS